MMEKISSIEFNPEQTKMHKRDVNLEKMNKLAEALPSGIARNFMISLMEKYIEKTEKLEKGLSNSALKNYYEKMGLNEEQIMPFLDISPKAAEEILKYELEENPEVQGNLKGGQIAKVAEYFHKKGKMTIQILACLMIIGANLSMDDKLRKIDWMPDPVERLEYVVPDGGERVKMVQKDIDKANANVADMRIADKDPKHATENLAKYEALLDLIIGTKFVNARKNKLAEKDKSIINDRIKDKSEEINKEIEKAAEDAKKMLSADLRNAKSAKDISSAYDKCWNIYLDTVLKYKYQEQMKEAERELGKLKDSDDDLAFISGHETRGLFRASMQKILGEGKRIIEEM